MRRALAATIALAVGGLAAPAGAQPDGQTIAIVHGTLWPGDGDPVANATVVVRDGRVVSVTPGGAPPAGARVIDAGDGVITPGFVGTQTALGLVEISLEPSTVDEAPQEDDPDPVRASFSAADGYNPTSTLVPVARRGGVTSVVSTPRGGLVSGTSAWMDLAGGTLDEVMAEEATALHVNLDDGGVEAAGGARPSALGRLREALDDARLYRQRRASYDRRGLRELSLSRLDLERLAQALAGDLPVVVRVARSHDILRVLSLASDYGIDLVLAGAEEGWMVAQQIADADVPVIVQPMTNLPSQFSRLHSRYDNAARLEQAGVRVVLSTGGAHGVRNLRQEAGNAIATGLSREAALRGLTVEPARVFGLDDRYGTVAPGRVANLVIWTGDPFEVTTWARGVLVRGRDVPLASRQTLLFERYRDLERVPRGQRGLPRRSDD
ncbi:MAG TPA: amidohydrolase family protein [Sandaracinaceae bacterium LLY-WYZ-13_1]|nr:amidohydrolase family protein [Sandaracinaceae bacterium LLY-WYZ-13_1]